MKSASAVILAVTISFVPALATPVSMRAGDNINNTSAPAPSQTGQIDPNAVNPNAPVKREIEYDHEFLTGLVARGSKSNGKSGSRRRVRRHSPTT
ncbi:unnamed protein product [Somion occarium]|uniref:Uncharacterized protein n=1 Tax=Somion occarium TaxID=3059160 RepID=A0ABP1DWN4_9APHY